MSQDKVSDALNEIMNAKKAKKESLKIEGKTTKLLIKILEIMKKSGYISYKLKDRVVEIELVELDTCRAIKPRFNVNVEGIEKYRRRFLPARDFGYLIISTNKGLMTHQEAQEKNVGGNLIAYVF